MIRARAIWQGEGYVNVARGKDMWQGVGGRWQWGF